MAIKPLSHSRIGHYFFSYLLTCEVYSIEVLKIMAQMWQYIFFFSLKQLRMTLEFIFNYVKKVVGDAATQIYQKHIKNCDIFTMNTPPGVPGVSKKQKTKQKDQQINNLMCYCANT
jgi:hypothetical protein